MADTPGQGREGRTGRPDDRRRGSPGGSRGKARARRAGGRRGGSARPPAAAGDPARSVALDVLTAVREQDAYSNLLLPPRLRAAGLDGRDAAFATELVSGALRRQGTYDAVLATCVDRPLDKLDGVVVDVLRLGCHQLLGMRVPAHAAVGTSVDLVRGRVGRGPSGLVNAVLRKVAAADLETWVDRVAPDPARDPWGALAVTHSHPRWVVDALAESLAAADGLAQPDPVETAALLAADNAAPRVTLAAHPGLATVAELEAAGGRATGRSPYAVELPGGAPGDVPAVAEGRAAVQDEGSQVVALATVRAVVEGRDERWLDMCAGPGGKASLLTALAAERGSRLLASERAPHRASLVRRATRASREAGRGPLGVVAADGTRPPWRAESFDRVLLDAPCTGLGALRRRAEARWRRRPDDLESLVPLQTALLDAALSATRPGGVVLYATCSPVLAETTGVVGDVLSRRSDAALEDATALVGELPAPVAGSMPGTVQLWPHRHGTDAMFLALLRRVR